MGVSAYRRGDFEALARHAAVTDWAADGLVDAAAAEKLRASFPHPFHTPNLFIRIGLFLFGVVCACAAFGLAFLMTGTHGNESGIGGLLFFFGLACLGVAELLAKRKPKPYYRAGLEEAAAYMGIAAVISGTILLAHPRGHAEAFLSLAVSAACGAAALRYMDGLLATGSMAALYFAVFAWFGRADLGAQGLFALPLLAILLSAAIAFACGRALRTPGLAPWAHLWSLLRLLALICAYAGGNYFVVREVGGQLMPDSRDTGLPFTFVFYAWTFAVPVAYMAWGLIKKDRPFLDAGLAVFAAGIWTYKHYHDVMPIETGLILAGLAMLAFAWIVLKAFRPARFGVTAAPDRRPPGGLLNAESLAAWNSFSSQHPSPAVSPSGPDLHGGGGGFGGGGAQGKF